MNLQELNAARDAWDASHDAEDGLRYTLAIAVAMGAGLIDAAEADSRLRTLQTGIEAAMEAEGNGLTLRFARKLHDDLRGANVPHDVVAAAAVMCAERGLDPDRMRFRVEPVGGGVMGIVAEIGDEIGPVAGRA